MKVLKITTKDGQVFHCQPDTKVQVDQHARIAQVEHIEMTTEEYNSIPATVESAEFFKQ